VGWGEAMILTITIHPLLEKRLIYKTISSGKSNKNPIEELKAGGKGINVSRQLNKTGIKNLAFTFLGGNNGKILKGLLSEEKIDYTFVQTKNETRYSILTIDESKQSATNFFGSDYIISFEEAGEFAKRLDKMIQNCEIVVFSGSSPCKGTDFIIPFGIETANKYDKISVCDTYGYHLKECIEKSPTILHNNVEELEESFKISLQSEKEKSELLDSLYSKGIKQAFITNGRKEVYASNFDYHYKVENPIINEIDATGSGDCFVAGIVYGWYKDFTFEETLKLAVALGALNVKSFDVGNVPFNEAENLAKQINPSPVGKRMKILDVTPINK